MEPVQPGLYEAIITERLKKGLLTPPSPNPALFAVFGDLSIGFVPDVFKIPKNYLK